MLSISGRKNSDKLQIVSWWRVNLRQSFAGGKTLSEWHGAPNLTSAHNKLSLSSQADASACRTRPTGIEMQGWGCAVCSMIRLWQYGAGNKYWHEPLADEGSRESVDARCKQLTASWVRERHISSQDIEVCDFYETLEAAGADAVLEPGVYTLQVKVLNSWPI